MTRQPLWRFGALALITCLAFGVRQPLAGGAAQDAGTPAPAWSCDDEAMSGMAGMGTPIAGMDPGAMDTGTPGAMMTVEFDQLYIDMMIPHHASIIAMAQAALPHLTDERLRTIAQNIVTAQTAEIEELRGYREQFYGSPDPAPLDHGLMEMMGQSMPGMGPMDEMAFQMDAAAQVAAICAAEDADLAFVDLTIPHHEMAIAASEAALTQAVHPEIKDFAQRVIDAQRAEIDELVAIRAELTGAASPMASPGAVSHGGPVVDQVGLVDALRAAGFTVDPAGSIFQPFLAPLSSTVIRVSGGALPAPVEIQVFEYADEGAAAADAAQIGPDGNPRTAIVEWVAPPHFFRAGRLIVLYVGGDPAVIDVLSALLGPPFAGQ